MEETAYDNRTTVELGGKDVEIEASNLACRIYADEFREHDREALTGDKEKDAKAYSGKLIHDILLDRQNVLDAGESWPEWDDIPRILAAIWAMARAAGSTKLGWKAFRESVGHAPANLYEASTATNKVLELGNRTFFRLPAGLRDSLASDKASEAEQG